MKAEPSLALVCSVDLEAQPLLRHLEGASRVGIGPRQGWMGRLGDVAVLVAVAGMGKANAASTLTALLEAHGARAVIGFGVAGAYPSSGLELGQVALASVEHYGDEGVAAPDGWLSTREIGIPLAEGNGRRFYNDLPVDAALLAEASTRLARAGLRAATGPFVTVSCCSGTESRGRELEQRFGAIGETMEGAAYAHIAQLYALPYLGLRGISNRVEDRDLSGWRLGDAARAAADALALVAAEAGA